MILKVVKGYRVTYNVAYMGVPQYTMLVFAHLGSI